MLLGYLGLKREVVPGMRIVVVPSETSCMFWFFWSLLSCGGIGDGSSGSAEMDKFKFSCPIFGKEIISKQQNVHAGNFSVQLFFKTIKMVIVVTICFVLYLISLKTRPKQSVPNS